MTEIPVSPEIWKLAAAILTAKQICVLDLRERHGYSWNQLAIALNTTRSTVKEHHRAATKNLLDAIEAAGGDIELAYTMHVKPAIPEPIIVPVKTNRQAFAREDAQPRPLSDGPQPHKEPA